MEDFLTKTTYVKNLNKLNFNSQLNVNIDANANIKTILDVESYLYDSRVECASGKATINAKLGVKVLYIDTDNITNTITDNANITETLTDASITADSFINLTNVTTTNRVIDSSASLKISCETSVSPILYLNIGLGNNSSNYENLIVKKSEIETCSIGSVVNTNFDYSVNLETKNNISKVLMYNAYFAPSSVSAEDGRAIVEGKIFSKLIYETQNDADTEIKELSDTFNLKTEIEVPTLSAGDSLDLDFSINKNKEVLNTELEEGNSVITINHNFEVHGVSLKTMSVEVVDDMYSTENEIDISTTNREFSTSSKCSSVDETISGEITIEDVAPAIDCIIANLNINADITNSYVKDDNIFLEGVISSCVVYQDENKGYVQKPVELPFIINTHIKTEKADCLHTNIAVCDVKAKAKRGTIIELEYDVKINVCLYLKESKEMLNTFVIGKPLDFSAYDYQIFLAKPGESMWDVCKRIKISPEDLNKTNKELPLIMEGGEKIIIKRG